MSEFKSLLPRVNTKKFLFKSFTLGFILSFLIFIPYIIADGGRFFFYGDFNVQQVPFYKLAHETVRSGNFGWSHLTDLGANFIGSYSFYLLGSPFFWLTIPFPNDWIPFLMAPLLMLKFACATLSASLFLKRYVKNLNVALIGALLYAFSGFSLYNVFFNHFHEAIVVFPLLLYALDEFIHEKRRGLFCLVVAFSCLSNYYFFVGQVVFTLIYFFLRLICKSYKVTIKEFALLVLEAVLGFMMACILLIPSVLTVMQNYRVSNPIEGWNAVMYPNTQRYVQIISSFFFPPDLAARPNFAPDSGAKWASVGAWLPLFSVSGVVAWMQIRRKHWLKKMLFICIIMALVPGLNAAFHLFNASYYARWYYMFTLMLALATVMALEHKRADFKKAIKRTSIVTAIIALTIGFTPALIEVDDVETLTFGLYEYRERFFIYVALALLSLAALTYLFLYYRNNKEKFIKRTTITLSAIIVFYGSFFIMSGKTQSASPYDKIIPNLLTGTESLGLDDLDTVRSDFYESLDNSGMYWQIPTIQAFHSIVPGSIMEYYDFIGVQRDVGSRPEAQYHAIRALTSVRWLFDDDSDDDYFAGEDYSDPATEGFVYHSNANGFDIWENEYYIPMGFSYDYYLTESDAKELSETQRQYAMLAALVIKDEDEAIFSAYLQPYDQAIIRRNQFVYEDACLALIEDSATNFEYTNTGFVAHTDYENSEFVFFSVPYEDGFTATVNGELATIYQVNVGFMAVEVPAGENVTIQFYYQTPGLSVGMLITSFAVAIFITYIYVTRKMKNKQDSNQKRNLFSKLRVNKKFSEYCKVKNCSFNDSTILKKDYRL